MTEEKKTPEAADVQKSDKAAAAAETKKEDSKDPWTGESKDAAAKKEKKAKAKSSKATAEGKQIPSYAIVEAGGQQIKVTNGQTVTINRVKAEKGQEITFDKVLMTRAEGSTGAVVLGAPYIEGAAVGVKVVRHLRGEKIKVFKKKRRQGYKKTRGHRQELTELLVTQLP